MDNRFTTTNHIGGDPSVRPKVASIARIVRGLGYTAEQVSRALSHLLESRTEVTYDSLIDAAFDASKVNYETNVGTNANSQRTDTCQPVTDRPIIVHNSQNDDESERNNTRRRITRENTIKAARMRKKEELLSAIEALRYKCRVCNDADATILLLPCAHLVCCDSCLMDVRRCPLASCNRIVRGTKEVFCT